MSAPRSSHDAFSFGEVADAYDRARPTYPEAAVDWLLPPGARRVLDLGCGTGKLTAALVARGLAVTAVNPLEAMLARLRRKSLDVAIRVGTAEAIPLPAASVDAVLVAQAWHWVDPVRAAPEIARVLRPGGTLGLVWNARDASHAWVAALNRVLDGGDPVPHFVGSPIVGPSFAPLQRHGVHWARCLCETDLLDLAASRSHYAALSPEDRLALRQAVSGRFATLPRSADAPDKALIPHVTWCFRTRPVAGA